MPREWTGDGTKGRSSTSCVCSMTRTYDHQSPYLHAVSACSDREQKWATVGCLAQDEAVGGRDISTGGIDYIP